MFLSVNNLIWNFYFCIYLHKYLTVYNEMFMTAKPDKPSLIDQFQLKIAVYFKNINSWFKMNRNVLNIHYTSCI